MNKILTIVVPSYNVEHFLEQCVESLCVNNEMEVLVVNDGSTDTTLGKALKLKDKYTNIVKVIDKENGGHGSAVNAGISQASGKYFKVVDADDWVDSSNLIKLVEVLKKSDADMIVSPFDCVIGEEQKHKRCNAINGDGIIYYKQYNMEEVCNKFFARMHSIIFKTSILKENEIRLDEHSYYVDMEYNVFAIPYINTVIFTDESVYMYRLGNSEQSVSITNLQKNREQHNKVFKRLVDFYCEQKDIGISRKAYIARGCAFMLENQIQIYLGLPPSKEIKKEIKDMDIDIKMRCPQIYSSVRKRSVQLLRLSRYHLYWIASVVYRGIYCKFK